MDASAVGTVEGVHLGRRSSVRERSAGVLSNQGRPGQLRLLLMEDGAHERSGVSDWEVVGAAGTRMNKASSECGAGAEASLCADGKTAGGTDGGQSGKRGGRVEESLLELHLPRGTPVLCGCGRVCRGKCALLSLSYAPSLRGLQMLSGRLCGVLCVARVRAAEV